MIINISKKREQKIRKALNFGACVSIGSIGVLKIKKRPDRKAYHNFSKKTIKIAGYSRIVFIEKA